MNFIIIKQHNSHLIIISHFYYICISNYKFQTEIRKCIFHSYKFLLENARCPNIYLSGLVEFATTMHNTSLLRTITIFWGRCLFTGPRDATSRRIRRRHVLGVIGRRTRFVNEAEPTAQARHSSPSKEQTNHDGADRQRQGGFDHCTGLYLYLLTFFICLWLCYCVYLCLLFVLGLLWMMGNCRKVPKII